MNGWGEHIGSGGVSVLIPAYNAAEFIGPALDSVTGQTRRDIRILVIDDGSTDHTFAIVAARAASDPRIQVLRGSHTCLANVLNLGLEHLRTDWVVRMDADDRMDPLRIARQLAFAEANPDTDVIASRVAGFPAEMVTEGFRRYLTWQNRSLTHDAIFADLFRESPICHPSVMLRRTTILQAGGYREIDGPEDYDMWLRLARAGARFAKLPETLLHWRVRPGSLSRCDRRYRSDAFRKLRWSFLACYLRERFPHMERPLWICGAGRAGRKLGARLEQSGWNAAGYIDVDPGKIGRAGGPENVRSIAVLETDAREGFLLFTPGNWGAAEEFEEWMARMGRRILRDYLVV